MGGSEHYQKICKGYEERYSQPSCYWGTKHCSLAARLLSKLPQKSTILDLGAGEGRNAIYLAKNGHMVTAVDFSEKGIRKIEKRAKKNKVHIDTIVANISDREFVSKLGSFDAILANKVIQFLKQEDGNYAVEYIKEHTKPGGYVAIASVAGNSNELKFFKPLELYQTFDDDGWDVRYYSKSEEKFREIKKLVDVVEILAQKPQPVVEKRRKEDWVPTGPQPGDD
jgi:cyclopropane fatty-acyl-phospholipid synthase-like methyltransferase